MKTPIMLAFSVLLLFFHKNAPAQNKFSVSTYEIIDFQQLEGQPQWQQSILKKIAGAQWIFSLDDQTFLFTMPNVRNDLYPIRGNFELNNEDIFFIGHARSQIGNTALSMAEISGRIYQQGNRTYLTMSCTVSSSSAAVVYGQKFSSGSTSAYEFTVSLRDYSNSVTPIYSGSNDYIAKMTQDVVQNAIRVANGGMTKEEKETAMDNLPIDTKAVIGITKNIYSMHELMDRASRGDYQAQKELEKQVQWLEYMAGTLQAWTASGQISNGVRKHQLALNWKNAAQHDRDMGRYFVKEGDMNRARFHAERANDFKQSAEKLLAHP